MNLGANPMAFTTSSASWKSGDVVPERFPAGLRVLVVDDDSTCLRILEKMLKKCLYEVTTRNRAEVALELLRDNKDGFDVVISDVHMPDMDGFKLLEHVGLEMDLPVIMMSADDSKTVVLKGVTHGACDYLIKPVRMEALKNIWQHVVRKKEHKRRDKDFKHSGSVEDGEQPQKPSGDVDCSSAANEGNWKGSKKRKDDEAEAEERGEASTSKKQRVVWTVELHQQFVNAVNQLGIDKAVPKKILELMNVPDLTRENVASHLQKYRLYLRRLSGQHQSSLGNSFIGPTDASFGHMSSLNGRELQALASSGQLPPQNLATIQAATLGGATNKSSISAPLADQRNIFSFRSPKIRFVEGQKQHNSSSKQVNLLHGIPTNMYPKQLAGLHVSAQPFGNMNMHVHSQPSQSSSLRAQMVQPQSRNEIPNKVSSSHVLNLPSSVGQPVFSQAIPGLVLDQNGTNNVHGPRYISLSQPSATVDFARNTFPVVSTSGIATPNSNGMLQEEFTLEMQGSGGFVHNYDAFNELNQKRTEDWGLQSAGSMFDAPQHSNMQGRTDVAPSILAQPGISSDQNNGHAGIPSLNKGAFLGADGLGNTANLGQHLTSSRVDNSLRIKAERLLDMGFHNDLFPDQFGQEDLINAISNQHQEGMAPVENEFGFDGYHLDNLLV